MTPKGLLVIIYIYFAPSMCPITKQGCRPAKLFAQLQHDIYQIKQTWQSKTDSLGKKENSQHVQLQVNWIGANLPLGISHIGTRVHRHPQVCIFIWNITKNKHPPIKPTTIKIRLDAILTFCIVLGWNQCTDNTHTHTGRSYTMSTWSWRGQKESPLKNKTKISLIILLTDWIKKYFC